MPTIPARAPKVEKYITSASRRTQLENRREAEQVQKREISLRAFLLKGCEHSNS